MKGVLSWYFDNLLYTLSFCCELRLKFGTTCLNFKQACVAGLNVSATLWLTRNIHNKQANQYSFFNLISLVMHGSQAVILMQC